MQSECAFYNVQEAQGEHGWKDVEGTEYTDEHHAITKAETLIHVMRKAYRVVNQRGAPTWPPQEE